MHNEAQSGRRIGIVEDEAMIAMLMSEILSREGFDVVYQVATPDEAVDNTRSRNPDIILMDVNLGQEKDGIDAAMDIREFSDVPIIFITAYSDESTLRRADSVHPEAFLTKPIRRAELLETIQKGIA
ncbi:response regulator [Methanovulcanius yangii]|uniref:response regulator n=1 Tax=Methanovulcanius yangii TaxID=1789227 RepID=UPI0029C9E8F2|nr:response regulator [Methanovulcanius yangii]